LYLALFAMVLSFASCNGDDGSQPPLGTPTLEVEANFEVASSFLDIVTTNTSRNGVAYAWDFGDGVGTSTEFEPTYSYAEPDTYTITLTVTGEDGTVDVFQETVSVDRNVVTPTASFTYAEEGTYTVTLVTTSSSGDTATTSQEVVITGPVAPVAAFSSSVTGPTATFTNETQINDGTNLSYLWDFGDGNTSTEENPVYTYAMGGDFDVTLTVTFDEINGETMNSVTQTITVFSLLPPVADFEFAVNGGEVTFTDTTVLNDGMNVTYLWDFGDGNTSTDQNPVHTYTTTGAFPVMLTVTFDEINGETTSSITQTVAVDLGGGGGPGFPGNLHAFISDTSSGDTGELRLSFSDPIVRGRMTATIRKTLSEGQDAFVNLSGTSTSRRNGIIDIRVNDNNGYEFTESGATINDIANFPAYTPDLFVELDIAWDASNGVPIVTVMIDGQLVADPFPTESQDMAAVMEGLRTVQFRFGGGSAVEADGVGVFVDNIRVYDSSNGTEQLFFLDEFENYTVGNSLDPNAAETDPNVTVEPGTPYHNNSFQAVVNQE